MEMAYGELDPVDGGDPAADAGSERRGPELLDRVQKFEPLTRADTDEAFARLDDARHTTVLSLASIPGCLQVLKTRLDDLAEGRAKDDCYALEIRGLAGMDLSHDRTGESLQGRTKVQPAQARELHAELVDAAPDPDWSRVDPREQIGSDPELDGVLSAVLRLRPGSTLMREMVAAFADATAECGRLAGRAQLLAPELDVKECGEDLLLGEGVARPRLTRLVDCGNEAAAALLADIAKAEERFKASMPIMISAVRTVRRSQRSYARAVDAVVSRNLLLVGSVLKRNGVRRSDPLYADLVQEGAQGLTVAAERFDRLSGFQFSTYANWWILSYIQRYEPESDWTVRMPWSAYKDAACVAAATGDLEAKLGRKPSVSEIAEHSQLAPARVRELQRELQRPVSLDSPVGGTEDLRLSDVLAAPAEEAPDAPDHSTVAALIRQAVKDLPADEQEVVCRRFGLDGTEDPPSYGDLANELGLCKETIRNRERGGIKRMLAGPHGPALRMAMELVRD